MGQHNVVHFDVSVGHMQRLVHELQALTDTRKPETGLHFIYGAVLLQVAGDVSAVTELHEDIHFMVGANDVVYIARVVVLNPDQCFEFSRQKLLGKLFAHFLQIHNLDCDNLVGLYLVVSALIHPPERSVTQQFVQFVALLPKHGLSLRIQFESLFSHFAQEFVQLFSTDSIQRMNDNSNSNLYMQQSSCLGRVTCHYSGVAKGIPMLGGRSGVL